MFLVSKILKEFSLDPSDDPNLNSGQCPSKVVFLQQRNNKTKIKSLPSICQEEIPQKKTPKKTKQAKLERITFDLSNDHFCLPKKLLSCGEVMRGGHSVVNNYLKQGYWNKLPSTQL